MEHIYFTVVCGKELVPHEMHFFVAAVWEQDINGTLISVGTILSGDLPAKHYTKIGGLATEKQNIKNDIANDIKAKLSIASECKIHVHYSQGDM